MKRLFDGFFRKTGLVSDPSQRNVISRVVSVMANGAIAFTVLGTVGIDTSPLLAAAGITGATVGFACRDYGANIVAGIALVGQPCFRTGKRVAIGVGTNRVVGIIDHWDIRYLYLRGDKGELIQVPNNLVLNSVITLDKPKKEDIEATWADVTCTATTAQQVAAFTGIENAGLTATADENVWKEVAKVACQKKVGDATTDKKDKAPPA